MFNLFNCKVKQSRYLQKLEEFVTSTWLQTLLKIALLILLPLVCLMVFLGISWKLGIDILQALPQFMQAFISQLIEYLLANLL